MRSTEIRINFCSDKGIDDKENKIKIINIVRNCEKRVDEERKYNLINKWKV